MSKQIVYLAGPINDSNDPARWRNDVISATNNDAVEYINPLDLEVDLDNPEDVVMTDLRAIKQSDAIIIHHEPGIEHWGTPIEGFVASRKENTKVITWIDRFDGNIEDLSPWLRFITDDFTTTGRDAINKALRA